MTRAATFDQAVLLDQLPTPVLVIEDERVAYANPAGLALFARPPAEVLGRPLEGLLARDGASATLLALLGELSEDWPAAPLRIQRPDGAVLAAVAHARPLPGAPRRILLSLGPNDLRDRSAILQGLAEAVFPLDERRLDDPARALADVLGGLGLSVFLYDAGERLVLRQVRLYGEAQQLQEQLPRPLEGRVLEGPLPEPLGRALAGERVCLETPGPGLLLELLGSAHAPVRHLVLPTLNCCALKVPGLGESDALLAVVGPDLTRADAEAIGSFARRCVEALAGARQLREFEALLRLANVAGSLDAARIRQEAVEIIARAAGAECVGVFESTSSGPQLAIVRGRSPEEAARCAQLEAVRQPPADPHAFVELTLHGPNAAILRELRLSQLAALPLRAHGQLLGAVVAGRHEQRPFSAAERSLLRALCAALASGIETARVYDESRQQAEDSRRLFELGRAVAGELDLPRVFRLAARTAAGIVDASEVFLLTPGEGADAGQLVARACLHDALEGEGAGGASRAHALVARARDLALAAMRARSPLAETGADGAERPAFAAAPLTAGERPVGCLVAVRLAPGKSAAPFREHDLQRLRAVADYAAVAAQSAGLFAEQQRRVRELVLLNEVASDCAELGLDRLLPQVIQRICRALPVELAALCFFDKERNELLMGAVHAAAGPLPPSRVRIPLAEGLSARVLRSRQPRRGRASEFIHPDISQVALELQLEHAAAVPLLVKDRAIGLVSVARAARPLTDDELRLLSAICSEIAVAIDNARLFAETQRRAQDLALVQSIGDVIARSLDRPLILSEASSRLCDVLECEVVRVYVREGPVFRAASSRGLSPDHSLRSDRRPPEDPVMAVALVASEPVELVASELDEPSRSFLAEAGVARLAVAPLRVAEAGQTGEGEPSASGVLVIGRRAPRGFGPAELKVLGAVSSQLAVALQNARLFEQTRQRAEDLSIVSEAGRALVGAVPLREALDVVADRLRRLMNVRACFVLLREPDRDELHGAGVSGVGCDLSRIVVPLSDDTAGTRAVRTRRPCLDTEFDRNPFLQRAAVFDWPPCWGFSLPLMSGDQVVGVVTLVDSDRARRLSQEEIDRAMAIGNQIAIAIERARLNTALERSLVELAQAQAQLVRRERLAALGELAALVAHEVRNPLGVIFNSLGSLQKLVHLEGDARRVYEIIREEADRLNRIVGDMLDYTRPTEPLLRPGPLEQVLRDALASASASERNRGTPVDRVYTILLIDPKLPPVPMDERLLHQAVVNLLSNAYQSLQRGGRVELSARLVTDNGRKLARVTIADDGPGIPEEAKARLFEPFFTTKATGSGLGLAVVKRIIDGHRGEVSVQSSPGKGTRFVIDLPLEPPPPPVLLGA